MATTFKPPKPRTYTGDNGDRDENTLDAWIEEVQDYTKLLDMTDDQKFMVLQYFLSGTAKDFYQAKRHEPDMTFKKFISKLKEFIIPTTAINDYWDEWNKISQSHHGKVDRIQTTAIKLEKLAHRLGAAITNGVKIQ